jgi:hypothetical protein
MLPAAVFGINVLGPLFLADVELFGGCLALGESITAYLISIMYPMQLHDQELTLQRNQ